MNPGDLRHRVEIGRYAAEFDEHTGDPLPRQWERVAFVWAVVEGLRGGQYFQAQQTVNQADHKTTIRYRRDIDPGMIVRHGGRELTVQSVLDEEGRRRWLTLICKEVDPA